MEQRNKDRCLRPLILGIVTVLILGSAPCAHAQTGEILQDPLCFRLVNTADHKMYGSFVTDFYTTPDGTQARHRSNFRLDEKGSKDKDGYPSDMAEFCSYGPFYEGRKLELVLRTLVPVFSCKTSIEQGEIILKSHRDEQGILRMEAECFE